MPKVIKRTQAPSAPSSDADDVFSGTTAQAQSTKLAESARRHQKWSATESWRNTFSDAVVQRMLRDGVPDSVTTMIDYELSLTTETTLAEDFTSIELRMTSDHFRRNGQWDSAGGPEAPDLSLDFEPDEFEAWLAAVHRLEARYRQQNGAPLTVPSLAAPVVATLQPPVAMRFDGKPTCKVEGSTQLAFCVRSGLDESLYPEKANAQDYDWYLRVREGEPGVMFEPSDTDVMSDGFTLEIAQSHQLYGKDADPSSTEKRLIANLAIEELRALFHGMTVLRARMLAAGLAV